MQHNWINAAREVLARKTAYQIDALTGSLCA
jgi:hypothetical protein